MNQVSKRKLIANVVYIDVIIGLVLAGWFGISLPLIPNPMDSIGDLTIVALWYIGSIYLIFYMDKMIKMKKVEIR